VAVYENKNTEYVLLGNFIYRSNMTEIIADYEQEYGTITADITAVTCKLKIATSIEDVESYVTKVTALFNDANEVLEQIELEVHQLDAQAKPRYKTRLQSYKKEMTRLKQAFHQGKTEASERTSRLQLFSRYDEEAAREESHQLLDNNQILENSSRTLDMGHKLLLETEEVGAGVLEDLSLQRETIERSRGRLREANEGLSQSNSVLSKMVFRAQQNKIVLFGVCLTIGIVLILGFYHLVTS